MGEMDHLAAYGPAVMPVSGSKSRNYRTVALLSRGQANAHSLSVFLHEGTFESGAHTTLGCVRHPVDDHAYTTHPCVHCRPVSVFHTCQGALASKSKTGSFRLIFEDDCIRALVDRPRARMGVCDAPEREKGMGRLFCFFSNFSRRSTVPTRAQLVPPSATVSTALTYRRDTSR
jgi:hypothetical protein